MTYQHTQAGPLVLLCTAFFALIAIVMFANGGVGAATWLTVAFMVAILAIVAAFNKLTITVDPAHVKAGFTWGWPHREIPLSDIVRVDKVRNKWWYGFGLRRIPNGAWMYNIWGLDAVELEMTNGDLFRLGTNDVDQLHAAISLRT